jgi:Na+-driven multidrug efflux pump
MEVDYRQRYRMGASKPNKRRQATVYLLQIQLFFGVIIGLSLFVYYS